jgi:hypothetical protein
VQHALACGAIEPYSGVCVKLTVLRGPSCCTTKPNLGFLCRSVVASSCETCHPPVYARFVCCIKPVTVAAQLCKHSPNPTGSLHCAWRVHAVPGSIASMPCQCHAQTQHCSSSNSSSTGVCKCCFHAFHHNHVEGSQNTQCILLTLYVL